MQAIPEVKTLSREEKVGQVLCLGWKGEAAHTVNTHARAVIEEFKAGSIVLMSRNLGTPEQTRALVRDLNSLAAMPLFVTVDQEGGWINRFGPPLHAFPGNMALGALTEQPGTPTPEQYAWRQAQATARELRAVGVNWNCAPVVDVNNNPDNPIIGVRSYGEDPEHVAHLGVATIRGFQEAGIVACAKHFPGHGDTSVDSHLALPTVPGDRARLEAIELAPFRASVAAGVGAIMTTHILFPTLDAERPATLSPAILTGLLREEMGFAGVVMTDCLEMHAIADTAGTARGAVEAIKAGADIALICHTESVQRAAQQALLAALESGELPEARLDEAVGRVLAAKRRFLAAPSSIDEAPWCDPAHDTLESEIAHAAITVVRNTGGVPIRPEPDRPVLVLSAHSAGAALAQALERHYPAVRHMELKPSFPPAQVVAALEAARQADVVIVATAPREPWSDTPIDPEGQAQLIRALMPLCGNRLIAVALREPYDLRHFPDVPNYVCTYGYRPCTLNALADALFGTYQPTGRLPVTIPGKK